MKTLKEDMTAQSKLLIEVTPEKLRQIADRLEMQAKEWSRVGEAVVYDAFDGELWVYHPVTKS